MYLTEYKCTIKLMPRIIAPSKVLSGSNNMIAEVFATVIDTGSCPIKAMPSNSKEITKLTTVTETLTRAILRPTCPANSCIQSADTSGKVATATMSHSIIISTPLLTPVECLPHGRLYYSFIVYLFTRNYLLFLSEFHINFSVPGITLADIQFF